MNKAEKLHQEVLKVMDKLNYADFILHLRRAPIEEIKNDCDRERAAYAMWLHSLVKLKKPKQVIELGAGWGNSTIMIGSVMPPDSKFYSVDLGLLKPPWGYLDQYYPSLTRILGNDLDLSLYPEGTQLEKTDIWYIDSEHTARHFRQELELYSPYFKKGAIVACDDIHLNDMEIVWNKLPYDKCDISYPCRPETGFGVFVV